MASKGIPQDRLQKFVDVYTATANASEAARAAGYKGGPKVVSEQARKLLKRADVQKMIEAVRAAASKVAIATRDERQEWWTRIMRGEPMAIVKDGRTKLVPPPLAERRKASELLGKAQGDFIKRVDVKVHGEVVITLPDNLRDPEAK